MKKIIISIAILFLVLSSIALAEVELPEGNAITLPDIYYTLEDVVNFIIRVAGIAMVFFIVLSGIMYMVARGDTAKVQKARDMFKTAVIGAIIVLSVGVLLNTISAIFTGNFFGFGGFGSPSDTGSKKLPRGAECYTSSDCASGVCLQVDPNRAICE